MLVFISLSCILNEIQRQNKEKHTANYQKDVTIKGSPQTYLPANVCG